MVLTTINPNKNKFNNLNYLERIFACGELYKVLEYDLLCVNDELFDEIQKAQLDDSIKILDLKTVAMLNNEELVDISLVLWREPSFNKIIGCAILEEDIATYNKAKELQSNHSEAVTIE